MKMHGKSSSGGMPAGQLQATQRTQDHIGTDADVSVRIVAGMRDLFVGSSLIPLRVY